MENNQNQNQYQTRDLVAKYVTRIVAPLIIAGSIVYAANKLGEDKQNESMINSQPNTGYVTDPVSNTFDIESNANFVINGAYAGRDITDAEILKQASNDKDVQMKNGQLELVISDTLKVE
jgi:hypothetical protein